ncbi:DUF1254 domain-containing protein [Nocardioides albidus]|uniref:DUF1254 domain-containing protein n=1 Tax=Nocardioides albidus TaxID=1517589 RepID=A0A5C4VSP3_9ACTN|nr:DUF1254 domain-containing protein [Nocardioides albidus]TNM38516.1 DUF1254 domain-containing protein [Nocardioides albidus]
MRHPFIARRGRRLAAVVAAASTGLAGLVLAAAPAPAGAPQAKAQDLRQEAYDAGRAAYVLGYPLVTMRRTQAIRTCRAAVNTMVHRATLATPANRDVVTPNNDTVYSQAWLDLRPGPQRLSLPPASAERYFSFQFLDMYTEVFDVAHGAAEGRSDVYVVGPDWHGVAPEGVRVVRSPTPDVWMIGRTFVNGPDDLAAAGAFQQQYTLTGPAGTQPLPPGTDCTTLPRPQTVHEAGAGFFDELEAALAANPPTKDERKQLKALSKLGDGHGDLPGADSDPAIVAGLEAAVIDGQAEIAQRAENAEFKADGWRWEMGIGTWGTDYLRRAAITLIGLGALPAEEAIYYWGFTDASGADLTGASTYLLHLPAGSLPPVEEGGFWSITMYDGVSRFLVDNPIDRYAINNATPGVVRNDDGSLDIHLQHDAPAGHESNWLPAPEGKFYVVLRLYLPQQSALDGTWTPPALIVGS